MKICRFVLGAILLAPLLVSAQQMVDPLDRYYEKPPTRWEGDGISVTVGDPDWLVEEKDWTYATPERIAEEEAARAAEQAAAEAAASLPLKSATGFAVRDSDGHWVELEPTGDGLPVIGVQISNSPITPEERASMKAERKAAHDALKAAAKDKKLNDKDKIALLMKAVFGVEE